MTITVDYLTCWGCGYLFRVPTGRYQVRCIGCQPACESKPKDKEET